MTLSIVAVRTQVASLSESHCYNEKSFLFRKLFTKTLLWDILNNNAEKKGGRLMKKYFFLTVVCVMGVSFLSVLLNYQIKDVIDAVSNQDSHTFFSQIAYLLGII